MNILVTVRRVLLCYSLLYQLIQLISRKYAESKTFNFWTRTVEIMEFWCHHFIFSKKLIWRNFCKKIVACHGQKNFLISTVCLSHLKILREINLQHSFLFHQLIWLKIVDFAEKMANFDWILTKKWVKTAIFGVFGVNRN